jgi:uncharacterized protein
MQILHPTSKGIRQWPQPSVRGSLAQGEHYGVCTQHNQCGGLTGSDEMNREMLLKRVKQVVHEIEPEAEIILYGSRARDEAESESDWDFLILVDGPMNDARIDAIRHQLYEIEWECGEVLCSVVRNRQEWDSSHYQTTPFHQNVERDGKLL